MEAIVNKIKPVWSITSHQIINNIKGIIYYSNYLKKRKEFRKMGELNIDFKSQKIDRDKIKFSKISYGLLFE